MGFATGCRLRRLHTAIAAGLLATLAVSACGSIGPESVPRDRIDYAGAIGDSWKQQTLLNIIKLRYGDVPVFLDVNQVIAGYEFNNSASAGFNASSTSFQNTSPSFLTLGGSVLYSGTYRDLPTVIYTPATGNDFITRLMTPIPPSAVLFLLQAGYPAERVMRLTLDSINGVENESMRRVGASRAADPDFLRLGRLISQMQATGALEVRIQRPKDAAETSLIVFGSRNQSTEGPRLEIAGILGLRPDVKEIRVFYGGYSGRDDEISMTTRSMLQIMAEVGFIADVPATDIAEGRAWPGPPQPASDDAEASLLRIESGNSPPPEAYVSVPYHGHWFWIADTDVKSKNMFASVMMLFSISDTGAKGSTPVVTVPTK